MEVRLLRGDTDLLTRPEFSESSLDQRRAELEAVRFQICGLSSSVRFDYPDAAVRAQQTRIGIAYIELARRLGASFVRVFGDVLPAGDQAARRETMSNIAAGFQTLGAYAEQRGIDVLIETHGDFADSRLMEALLAEVKSPAVGVLWDTHHPWRFFHEELAETYARLRPWVRHTHWKDSITLPERHKEGASADADARARQLMSGHKPADYILFGKGEFPAAECVRVLRDGGYQGWFSLEWEKAWHPEIDPPEVALPPFPRVIKSL